MSKQEEEKITPNKMLKILDFLYDKSVNGLGFVSKPIEEFAADYICKYKDVKKAAKAMLNAQVVKCTTSGFVTGFGGFLVMPVTIPANLSSVLYVQMRMIACTAYMAGYDLKSDQVQTFVYACLAGTSLNQVIKKFGVQLANKAALNAVKKIPGKVLVKINQKIGMRFVTKFGTKGLINLGKAIPVVGAAVNGGFDLVETKLIANRAYKMFMEGDFSVHDKSDKADEINIDLDDDE